MRKPQIQTILELSCANLGFDLYLSNPRIVPVSINHRRYKYTIVAKVQLTYPAAVIAS